MSWLFISVFAYFLNAIAITVDKFLLSKKIPNPAVYTFFICALSLLALVLIPFGFQFYSPIQIIIALIAGLLFAFALLFMFMALHENEATRITPFIGGVQPIFIFVLAWIFLSEKLSQYSIIAFFIIIIGTLIISWHRDEELSMEAKRSNINGYIFALTSTALFAVSYTINKYVYLQQDFISGFVWTRIGAFLGAVILLLWAKNRQDIMKEVRSPKKSSGGLFLFGQAAGAISFILVNYAISISESVAIVNALAGMQYVFLLVIVLLLSSRFPQLLEEKLTPAIIAQKIIATVFIIGGLAILAYV